MVNVTTREGPQERRRGEGGEEEEEEEEEEEGGRMFGQVFGSISVQTHTLYSLVKDDVLLTCESESQSVDSTL